MDHICLQLFLRQGPDILAMKETIETKYACDLGHKTDLISFDNVDYKGDLIYLQSQIRIGLYMLAISSNKDKICLQCLKSSWTNLAKAKFRRLQAYLVTIEKDCKYIKSDSDLRL